MDTELEKFAATMQQLRGAATRIGSKTPLQVGTTVLKSPEILSQVERERGRTVRDPELLVRNQGHVKRFSRDMGLSSPLSIRTNAQQKASDKYDIAAARAAKQKVPSPGNMGSLAGTIVMPPKTSPGWRRFALAANPESTPDPGGVRTLTHLHEGFERQTSPQEYLPTASHYSPRVLLNENNMLAGLRGPQSVTPKETFQGMRQGSGEAEGMQTLVNNAYGGRFPYEFGETKIPKAMRKNLVNRLLTKDLKLPNKLRPG